MTVSIFRFVEKKNKYFCLFWNVDEISKAIYIH